MGEETTKPPLLSEVVVEALLGLGGGKRIPCVGMVKVALSRFFFGFIFLLSIFYPP